MSGDTGWMTLGWLRLQRRRCQAVVARWTGGRVRGWQPHSGSALERMAAATGHPPLSRVVAYREWLRREPGEKPDPRPTYLRNGPC